MTGPTLSQRKGLNQYIALQADTRTIGQLRATERDWSSTPAEPVVQLYKPETNDLRPINRLICILVLALFVGLAWAFTTPTCQLLLEMIRSAS